MSNPVLLHLMGLIESLNATVRLLADRVVALEQSQAPTTPGHGNGNGNGKAKGA